MAPPPLKLLSSLVAHNAVRSETQNETDMFVAARNRGGLPLHVFDRYSEAWAVSTRRAGFAQSPRNGK